MRRYDLAAFFALSFLSGMFEIGVVFRGWAGQQGLLFPFCLALAYQLGTLAPYPINTGRVTSLMLGVVAIATLAALVLTTSLATWWLLPLVTMTSAATNLGRVALGKAEISTTLKRCARVAGFLCAPILISDLALCASVSLAVGLMSFPVVRNYARINPGELSDRPLGARRQFMTAALFFHQIHYFSYCTAIVVMLFSNHTPFLAVAIFIGGWISYIASPHIIGSKFEPERVALLGHAILTAVLYGLASAEPNSPAWYILWFLTGPFGGTIVYLTKYARRSHRYNEVALASVENLGHCVGSAIAVAWVAYLLPVSGLLIVASIFALLTAIALVLSLPTYRVLIWRSGR